MHMNRINVRAIGAGLFGATASCIAKLALAPDSYLPSCVRNHCRNFFLLLPQWSTKETVLGDDDGRNNDDSIDKICMILSMVSRGSCLLFMIGLNIVMVSLFIGGMNESGSVVGTAVSMATNFIVSAFYGICLFKERVSAIWFMGFAFILIGVWLLSTVSLVST